MNGYSWVEIGIMLVIFAGIGVAIWKGGQANPEGTGKLGREVGGLKTEVHGFGLRLGRVEEELDQLEKEAATKADIKRLERAVAAVQEQVAEIGTSSASREATLGHVKQQVDRLMDFIVNRGLEK